MTQQEKIILKNKLKQFCHDTINQRINAAKAAIENAQESANNEEKSSAGDKYETGRARGHLEKDMHSRQLSENLKELATLQAINTNEIYDAIVAGTFVKCKDFSFFIAAGLGKQKMAGETVLFLSPKAPLAELMQHKKAGAQFIFNKTMIEIIEIF